ncbi:hypothetical protein CAI21_02165 [Alkalilimnicola ehrlichii]|uniref:SH3b domain-containing protein n=1 Tax=Alkalilimnicola ehrlichii TaxID=351052 RepID=A0A3E0X0W5_9GAMM|nr:TIGR04211 family SH3 domain-containing protein [Alkalilimnicola ehrlichii]RFA31439.1 hypothetical protein CAI21_02165 [Alkalilimnicola ehrlichii]RFA39289.1 hypothetical protein CAL65_00225 [Alkalilimnicola ehrlichii]
MRYWIVLLVLLFSAQPLFAQQTRYVSDELQVDLRSGPTMQHRIVRFINAGTPLQVVESQGDWAFVRLSTGDEGWLQSRYVVNTPSARQRLQQATSQRDQARQQLADLRQQLSGESDALATAQEQIAELTRENERLTEQLGDAARGLELFDENRELKKDIVDLRREIQDRDAEINRLSDRSRQDWFVAGAGVLVGGMLLGIILPRIRWRRRSSWDRL